MNCSEEVIRDECIKVTCELDGLTASTYVTSMHLVADKYPQLKREIESKARAAFAE